MEKAYDTKILIDTKASIEEAATLLKNGELVAFPTETVYGLGANATDSVAVTKIFTAKGRPVDNPLIVHGYHADGVFLYAKNIPDSAYKLAEAFWPGPLTIILEKTKEIPLNVTAGRETVALRVPDNGTALMLLKEAKLPVAAPSANKSGRPSPTLARHVYEDFNGLIPLIIDGGECRVGIESTVADLSGDTVEILRPGLITAEDISKVLCKKVDYAHKSSDGPAKSPGMKYKHYSPRTCVYLVQGTDGQVRERIKNFIIKKLNDNPDSTFGIMACDNITGQLGKEDIKAYYISMGREVSSTAAAHNLFKSLREFDEKGVDIALIQAFQPVGVGTALMDRLEKAAGYKYI